MNRGKRDTGKTELAREVIEDFEGPFTLAELRTRLPSVSAQLIKKVQQDMKYKGLLHLTGRGRGARWEKHD